MSGRGRAFHPLLLGVAATVLALVTLATLGANATLLGLHAIASIVGFVIALIILRSRFRIPAATAIVAALALLAVAQWGIEVDDARRWIRLGPLTLQPALFLLPAVIATPDRRIRLVAIAIAMVALALQPDSGTLGALALALLADLTARRRLGTAALLLFAIPLILWSASGGLGPASVPYIEGVVSEALSSGILPAALAVAALGAGTLALRWSPPLLLFFGGLLAVSILGPFPTPLLGASASAILGFWVAVGRVARDRTDNRLTQGRVKALETSMG